MEVSASEPRKAVESRYGGTAVLADALPIKEIGDGKTRHRGGSRSPLDAVRAAIVAEHRTK
ncbi:MAG: hypothetical protein Q8K93_08845 [Reyranella sp.]|uniref:hypothetical protein n=1 Tax=Reyranella sp. TaxID=1929291 RepID=UPI002731DE03|nr:hypothetical protein [Reyranella sp.]MDP1962293.1 hypothetical protein [Reyranella sp.]MDP2376655.1 hypothetical protein [Reyranella sp.]